MESCRKNRNRPRKIDEAHREKRDAIIIGYYLGGVGGAVYAANEISELEADIKSFKADISAAEKEMADYSAAKRAYHEQQSRLKNSLDGLKAADKKLKARIESTDDKPQALLVAKALEMDLKNQLIDNLNRQVGVLRKMVGNAESYDDYLTSVILSLEGRIDRLEEQYEKLQRDTFSLIIDTVFHVAGISPKLKIGEFSFSKKKLLLDGMEYLHKSFEQQVHGLVEKMVTDGLVDSVGSRRIATMFTRYLGGKVSRFEPTSAVEFEVLQEFRASLSDEQRKNISPGSAKITTSRLDPGAREEDRVYLILHRTKYGLAINEFKRPPRYRR